MIKNFCRDTTIDEAIVFLQELPRRKVHILSIDSPLTDNHYTALTEVAVRFEVQELFICPRATPPELSPTALHKFISTLASIKRLVFTPIALHWLYTDELLKACAGHVDSIELPYEPPTFVDLYDYTEDGVLDYCFGGPSQAKHRFIRAANFHTTSVFLGKILRANRDCKSETEITMLFFFVAPVVPLEVLFDFDSFRRKNAHTSNFEFRFPGDRLLTVVVSECRKRVSVRRERCYTPTKP